MKFLIVAIFMVALIFEFGPELPAQSFRTLHSFTGGSDGVSPSGVVLSGKTLFGTAGPLNQNDSGGSLFSINIDGTGFGTLHSFEGVTTYGTNNDGANPTELILAGNTLYGTCRFGGPSGWGTIFAVSTNGTGFTILYSFSGSDGKGPSEGALALSGSTLYGATADGGSFDSGTVFSIETDGTGFTTLYSFTGGTDGSDPGRAGVVLASGVLYGTTMSGGAWNRGTVFAINTDGTGFTTLHDFTSVGPCTSGCSGYTSSPNNDGANPNGGVVILGSTLYGTTYYGGSWGNGTVFAVNTDGTGLTSLHNFTPDPPPSYTNADGAQPMYSMVSSENTLYGTTYQGGESGAAGGTVFALNTDGTGFTNLHSFGQNTFGGVALAVSDNMLYGTTYAGGSWGYGTVFTIQLPVNQPDLKIACVQGNIILTWPTNATGFTLQSITNLLAPAVWTPVSPGPVVVNGQNTVTNPISGTQQYYRLASSSQGPQ